MRFEVLVTTTGMGSAGTPQFEHLVVVLADSPREAELVATQMAACRVDLVPKGGNDHLMPLSSRVLGRSDAD